METVMKLCASGLEGSVTRVEGVIGVTVDDDDVFLIHINDTVHNSSTHVGMHMSPAVSMSSPAATATAADTAVSMFSPGHRRARHRLVFQSPKSAVASSHRHDIDTVENETALVIADDTAHGNDLTQQCELSQLYTAAKLQAARDINSSSSRSMQMSVCTQSQPLVKTDLLLRHEMTQGDVKLLSSGHHAATDAARPPGSVVVVDSDDEDVKLVAEPSVSGCDVNEGKLMNVVDTEQCSEYPYTAVRHTDDDAPSVQLRIADVVGNASGWSIQQHTNLPAPVAAATKRDLSSYHNNNNDDDDDDEVTMMEEENDDTKQLWANSTPPRHFQVIFGLYQPSLFLQAAF